MLLPSHVTSSRLQFVFLGSEQQTLVFSNGVTKGGVSIGDNCKFISLSVIISFAFSKHSSARLLAKNPQKVVTDDPTCFVDYKATFEILECTQCHVGTSAINIQKIGHFLQYVEIQNSMQYVIEFVQVYQ